MLEVKLEDIAINITDGKHGDCKNEEHSEFYFISCKDVHDGEIHYDNARQITEKDFIDTHKRTMLEPNDILITNSGTIGRMALVKDIPQTYKTTFQKSVAIIKPNKKIVRPIYLYYSLLNYVSQFISVILHDDNDLYFFYESMKRIKALLDGVGSNGATMTNVNKTKFSNIKVMYPTEDLVMKYNEFCKPIFAQILALSKANLISKQTRDYLLPKLMSGEIEV